MSNLLSKANDNLITAQTFHAEDVNVAANRYYYALYQIAYHYALTVEKRDLQAEKQKEHDLNDERRKKRLQTDQVKSIHSRVLELVTHFVNQRDPRLRRTFLIAKGYRETADYFPISVDQDDLDDNKGQIEKLFNLFDLAIKQHEDKV